MSNRTSLFWLTLLLVALTAANVMLTRYGGERTRLLKRTSLTEHLDDARSLVVSRKDRPSVRAVREGTWRLVEPFAASVDEPVVMRLLDALSSGPVEATMSYAELLKLGRSRSDFGLDDPSVEISVEAGKGTRKVSFGTLTAASNGVYAAIEGIDAVFVVPTNVFAAIDVTAESLRRRTLFDISEDSVAGFDVKRGVGSVLSFLREGEKWRVDGNPVVGTKAADLLRSVVTGEAVGFVWPVGATNESRHAKSSVLATYGLDPESAVTMTLKCVDGVDRQISFSIDDADDGLVYALVQNGSAVVTVRSALRAMAVQDLASFADMRLFPVEPSGVTTLSLVDGDVTCALARTADGIWRMDAPITATADSNNVSVVLGRLLALTAADAGTNGVRVSVNAAAESVCVRRDRILSGLTLEDLRSRQVLALDPSSVRRIVRSVKGAGEPASSAVFNREHRLWTVDADSRPGVVRAERVAAVLAALCPLTAVRVERLKVSAAELAAYGLDQPDFTIAADLETEASVRRNIFIGKALPDGSRFATVGSADAIFVLSRQSVGALTAEIVGK